jgi:hypothetical protein
VEVDKTVLVELGKSHAWAITYWSIFSPRKSKTEIKTRDKFQLLSDTFI